jgi:hypothetical protein
MKEKIIMMMLIECDRREKQEERFTDAYLNQHFVGITLCKYKRHAVMIIIILVRGVMKDND